MFRNEFCCRFYRSVGSVSDEIEDDDTNGSNETVQAPDDKAWPDIVVEAEGIVR